jgi:hypothetical protein
MCVAETRQQMTAVQNELTWLDEGCHPLGRIRLDRVRSDIGAARLTTSR